MRPRIRRRTFLKALGSAAACAGAPRLYAQQNSQKRPNILMIVSDDQGWGDLPANWPYTDVRMPVMESIGNTGIRFTDFYATPLCGPTRAALMTGQYSMENGMWRGPGSQQPGESGYRGINPGITLLPEHLQRSGYATGIFGKWHLGHHPANTPNARGFDTFYGFLGGAHSYNLGPGDPHYLHNKEPYCETAHATDYITDKALAFIRANANKRGPFFCYVPYNAVHGPLWRKERPVPFAKPEWLDRAEKRGIDFPRRDYVAILEHMDHAAGRLLDLLQELDIEEDTFVLFFSDNGAITLERQNSRRRRLQRRRHQPRPFRHLPRRSGHPRAQEERQKSHPRHQPAAAPRVRRRKTPPRAHHLL